MDIPAPLINDLDPFITYLNMIEERNEEVNKCKYVDEEVRMSG